MNIMINIVSESLMKKIGKEAVKAAAKVAVGVVCEVAIHFASKAIIKQIEDEMCEEEGIA